MERFAAYLTSPPPLGDIALQNRFAVQREAAFPLPPKSQKWPLYQGLRRSRANTKMCKEFDLANALYSPLIFSFAVAGVYHSTS